MALLNLLLLPILAALGLFTPDGDGGSGDGADKGTAGGPAGAQGNTSGNAGDATGSASGAAAGATKPADTKTKPAGGQAQPGNKGPIQPGDVEALQRELETARRDAGKYRAAGIQAIAEALGIELPNDKGEEGQQAAIVALQKEINSLRDESRSNAINAAFERVVGELGAKPVLTRRYVEDQLKTLDPKAGDFTANLKQIVQAAIDEEPALKATQAAARNGGEFTGGSGATTFTREQIAAMSQEEFEKNLPAIDAQMKASGGRLQ